MGRKEWDEAATAVAAAVVRVMPHLNEQRIRTRVFEFLANEYDGQPGSIYTDVNYYYRDDIHEILLSAFDSAEDDAMMAVQSDFRWAYDQLSDAFRYRILERYQHGVIRPHDSPERAQLNRAIRKLAEILNTWNRAFNYEGPGSREVWSNARSQAEIAGNDVIRKSFESRPPQ